MSTSAGETSGCAGKKSWSISCRKTSPKSWRLTPSVSNLWSCPTSSLVVFSGGEPTLLGDDLFEGIAYAHERRLLTRVVTNGFWGKSPEAAAAFVDRLIGAGLSEINISVDDLHQKYVPLWRVRNAYLACYEREFP